MTTHSTRLTKLLPRQGAEVTLFRTSFLLLFFFHATEKPHEIQHDEIQYKTISMVFIIILKGRNQLLEDYTQQQLT
jgi:hypothetical protein